MIKFFIEYFPKLILNVLIKIIENYIKSFYLLVINNKNYEEMLNKAIKYKINNRRTNEINGNTYKRLNKSLILRDFYNENEKNRQDINMKALTKLYVILLFEISYCDIPFPKEEVYELSKCLAKMWFKVDSEKLNNFVSDINYNDKERIYEEFFALYNNDNGVYTLWISVPKNGETYLSYNTCKKIKIKIDSSDIYYNIIKMGFDYEIEYQGKTEYLRLYAFNEKTKDYYAEFSSTKLEFMKFDKNSKVIWAL